MGQAISKYYRDHQGRGEHCTVEAYLRREIVHYFFAYPADYADTVIIYNDAGTLERQLQKAAFEVIFAYNESSGTLDLFVQGDKNLRRDMEEIFARLVLNEDLPEGAADRNPYELNGLRHRDFDYPTDPEDGIQEVRVKALRLSIVGPGFGRITFESDARRKRGDIYDLMEKSLNQARMDAEAVNVTRAVLDVVFATGERPKTVSFYVSHPDICSLKDTPEHLKLKDYLRRWGIASEN